MSCSPQYKKRKETSTTIGDSHLPNACCSTNETSGQACCGGVMNATETHPLKSLDEWDDWKREYELKQDQGKIKKTKDHASSDSTEPALHNGVSGSGYPEEKEDEKVASSAGVIPTDKPKNQFRNYIDGARQKRVEKLYKQQHSLQTLEFVKSMAEKYNSLNRFQMGVWEVLEYLDKIVDESDPDIDLTQLQHALQTAEACRTKWPDEKYDWIHLTGLIHDLGKILAVKNDELGLPGEPQWAVVGDTFPLGLPFSDKNVMYDFFSANPDTSNPKYNLGLGIYSKGCGLSQVRMSYGHDEYIYQVMAGNNTKLPTPALYMLRYHSFYPWHKEGAYFDLMDDQDREMLTWVKEFNECDLYSKSEAGAPDVVKLAPYYKKLIDKYMPGKLRW